MTYTGNGMVATVQDARSNITSYQYDSQDRITTVTYPGGATKLVAYDTKGTATTITDERSNVTTASYDAMNRRTGATDALGNHTTITYDSAGNQTSVQAPLSRTTTYAYDSMNRVTTITNPLSHNTVMAYDSGGNVKTVTDPLSRVTTFGYDAENRRTVVTDALSHTVSTTYDAEGEVTSVTDPLGRVTTSTYNSRGWVSTVTDPLGNATTYTYTATGKPSTKSDPVSGGSTESYSYDDDDRLISATDALSHVTTYGFDAVGNKITVTDANTNTTTYAYDSRNRLTTITDPLSHNTVIGYDSGGNKTTVTDANGHTVTTAYDALNRATTITDSLSGVTTIAFDAAGRETGLTDPVGNHTTWGYDAADRLTTLTSPNGTTNTYVYDNANQLTDTTDPNGRRVTYGYDSGGRQTGETWVSASPAETITSTYDADGELTAQSDGFATLTYTYDSGGRVITSATSSSGGQPSVTLASGYDGLNERTSLSDSGVGGTGVRITSFAYDANHRLTTISVTDAFDKRNNTGTAGPQVVFGYDAANRMTSESRTIGGSGTAVTTSFAYDNANQMTSITHQISGGSSLASFLYGYDSAGRLTTETNADGSVTYAYDATDQLTGVSGAHAETYTYDSNGNRTMSGYTTGTSNETTSGAGYTFVYDNSGNLTGKTKVSNGDNWTYTWDYRNRLTGVIEHNSGGSVLMQGTYTYDSLNRRIGVEETVGGVNAKTWTVYDGQNPYADFNGSGTLQQRYLYGPAVDEILARTSSGGTTAWYMVDKLGSVHDLANTSGTVIDHVAYDTYGNTLSESSPANGDRFKFAAREYDSVTGLYFNRARYYDPTTGRFINQDPIHFSAGDTDLYRYVGNSPTNATDPSGLDSSGSTSSSGSSGTKTYSQALQSYYYYEGEWRDHVRTWSADNTSRGPGPSTDWLALADAAIAGYADAYTAGLSTWAREKLYGDQVSAAHQSDAFKAGQMAAQMAQMASGMGNPCAMSAQLQAANRLLNAAQAAGELRNAYNAGQDGDYIAMIQHMAGAQSAMKQMSQSCFAAGTCLLTPDGYKAIEEFKVGDWVLSAPEDNPEGLIQPRQVEEVFTKYSPLLNLHFGGQVIRTTPEHPFWVRGRGWTAAHQLMTGDYLRSNDDRWVVLEQVIGEQESAPVYNICVAEYHTYFVGRANWGFAVWAHNTNGYIKPGAAGGESARQRFSESTRTRAFEEDPTRTCVFCRRPGSATQVDHAVPRSRGGNASLENAQLACPHCNQSKGARPYPVNPPPGYEGQWPNW
jgi:RHS repeat-associated protein